MGKFRADIEGLRGVAVLLVVLCHLAVPGFGGGFFGVDVFFVISGYLITGLLAQELRERRTVSILGFYARRARRILPAALTVIVAIVVAGNLVLNELQTAQIHHDAWWATFFASNIDFIRQAADYFAHDLVGRSPFQHYWSLAVEEQFYLVWPALFLIVARGGSAARWRARVAAAIAAIGIASLIWSIVATEQGQAGAYFSTFTRAWELALGALLAIATAGESRVPPFVARWSSAGGVVLFVAAFVLIDGTTPFPGAIALLPTCATALLILGNLTGGSPVPNQVLATRPLRFVGRISYSVYLWHWPFIIFAADLYPTESKTVWMRLLILLLTLETATLSFYLVEQPGRRIGVRSRRGRRRGRAFWRGRNLVTAACGACIVSATFAGFAMVDRQGSKVDLANAAASTAAMKSPPVVLTADGDAPTDPAYFDAIRTWRKSIRQGLSVRQLPPSLQPIDAHLSMNFLPPCVHGVRGIAPGECVVGNPAATHVAVLTGDSHAGMLRNAVSHAFNWSTWSVHLFDSNACGWAGGNESPVISEADCARHQARTLRRIRELHPDVLLLSEEGVVTPARSAADIASSLKDLTAAAKKTIVVGHTPVTQLWTECLAGNDISRCFATLGSTFRRDMRVEQSLATQEGAAFVDSSAWMCIRAGAQTVCPPVIDDVPVFGVTTHIGPEFGYRLVPIFKALLVSLGVNPR